MPTPTHGGRVKGVAAKSGAAPRAKQPAPAKQQRTGTNRTHVAARPRAGTHRTRPGP